MENTNLFDVSLIKKEIIRTTLEEVFDILTERGYNAVNQMVGYLMSGDPGYISSYKNARTMMQEIDRSEVIAYLLSEKLK